MRVIAAIAAAAALLASLAAGARAAVPAPDAHDRALAAQLNQQAKTFRGIAGGTSQASQDSLDGCAPFKKDPSAAFSAFFLMIPVFLAEVVNQYGSQIRGLRSSLATMHPDAPLFRKWLAAEIGSLDLLLGFDNHGKKVDLCAAAQVMLDKKSTDADIFRVTGLHGTAFAQLFANTSSGALKTLNPQMRTFFVAAGLSAADAKTLTSS